jgi:hypothetical protein
VQTRTRIWCSFLEGVAVLHKPAPDGLAAKCALTLAMALPTDAARLSGELAATCGVMIRLGARMTASVMSGSPSTTSRAATPDALFVQCCDQRVILHDRAAADIDQKP